jgi:hypothetical protein
MTIHTPESLCTLDSASLRGIYVEVIGRKPVAKSREQMVVAIIAAQTLTVADDVKASTEPVAEPVEEATNTDSEVVAVATTTEDEPPIRVKVIGTGSLVGSTLACDLLHLSATTATVSVLGQKVDFRTSDGEPVRARKGWATGGWRLDVSTLPEVREPTIEDLLQTPFRYLSVADLQKVYAHLLKRPTASTNRGYLTWVISEAKAGRVRSGGTRQRRGSGEAIKTVPLCLPVSTVGALDEAWKRCGYVSRIAFIRQAIGDILSLKGEAEVAKLFGVAVGE